MTFSEKLTFLALMHFTSWKYSTLWKFSLIFAHIFRADWRFLTNFGSSDPSFNKHFDTPILETRNFGACTNRSYSLINIIYQFLDMIWIWNLHWGYFLIIEVGQRFHQLNHLTFSENVFWSVNFTLRFCQICYIQKWPHLSRGNLKGTSRDI